MANIQTEEKVEKRRRWKSRGDKNSREKVRGERRRRRRREPRERRDEDERKA